MSEIVPFGKYRGQPVEALSQDKSYLDWLTAQPWFRERYATMYTLRRLYPDHDPGYAAAEVVEVALDARLRIRRDSDVI